MPPVPVALSLALLGACGAGTVRPRPAVDGGPAASPPPGPIVSARAGAGWLRHRAPVTAIDWSPTGALLAAVDQRARLLLWDPGTGALVRAIDLPPGSWPSDVAFAPDGAQVAVDVRIDGSDRGQLAIYDVATGDRVAVHALPNMFGPIEFHWLDRRRLAIVSVPFSELDTSSGVAVATGGIASSPAENVLFGLRVSSVGAAVSADRKTVVSLEPDDHVRVYRPPAPAPVIERRFTRAVDDVAIAPDGGRFAVADGAVVRLFERRGSAVREVGAAAGHRTPVRELVTDADERRVSSTSEDGTVIAWDAALSTATVQFDPEGVGRPPPERAPLAPPPKAVLPGAPRAAGCVASPDRRLMACPGDGWLVVLDATSGAALLTLRSTDGVTYLPVEYLAVSTRQQLVAAGDDRHVGVWSLTTGALVASIRDPGMAYDLGAIALVDPGDGGRLVVSGSSGQLWQIALSEPAVRAGLVWSSSQIYDQPLVPGGDLSP